MKKPLFFRVTASSFDSGQFIWWQHQYLNIGIGDDAAERDSVTRSGQSEGLEQQKAGIERWKENKEIVVVIALITTQIALTRMIYRFLAHKSSST